MLRWEKLGREKLGTMDCGFGVEYEDERRREGPGRRGTAASRNGTTLTFGEGGAVGVKRWGQLHD